METLEEILLDEGSWIPPLCLITLYCLDHARIIIHGDTASIFIVPKFHPILMEPHLVGGNGRAVFGGDTSEGTGMAGTNSASKNSTDEATPANTIIINISYRHDTDNKEITLTEIGASLSNH
jgi:hypothetical protein